MELNFNLDSIEYIQLDYIEKEEVKSIKLALKEKRENYFIAIAPQQDTVHISTPQKVSVSFIGKDNLYRTTTILNATHNENGFTYYTIDNPETLDFQHNREYYRIPAQYDCIYTIETGQGIESFNAVTYDISAGGVSIITSENIIPTRETSIVIFMPDKDLKAHLKFVRCELFEESYKLSFIFTDLTEKEYNLLSEFCITRQLDSF